MSNLGFLLLLLLYLFTWQVFEFSKRRSSQLASTADLMDCLSTVQHSEHQHFCEVGQEIKRFSSHCCIVP